MSAQIDNQLEWPDSLAILAGGGDLPSVVIEACRARGLEPFIVAFEGHTHPDLVRGRSHMWVRLGAVGKVLKALNAHSISDVVMIGKIRRPSLAELRPDMKAAAFFARAGFLALGGDDALLKALKDYLNEEGLRIHGAHKFAQELLTPRGRLGTVKPLAADVQTIQRGVAVLRGMSALDVGQAVIVQEGLVLGVEAVEGTDALIQRCGQLKRSGRGGVLVKLAKEGQDEDMDLPTAGPRTLELAVEAGLSGVVLHADRSLLLRKEEVAEIANRHKIFVIGIDPDSDIRAECS